MLYETEKPGISAFRCAQCNIAERNKSCVWDRNNKKPIIDKEQYFQEIANKLYYTIMLPLFTEIISFFMILSYSNWFCLLIFSSVNPNLSSARNLSHNSLSMQDFSPDAFDGLTSMKEM